MKPRLLVVDDDPMLTDSLRDILEETGYYGVTVVSTGHAGVQELQRAPFDLVLLDYNLPDGTGMTWAVHFQEIQPDLRILLMTGMAEGDMPQSSNIKGIIPKPTPPPMLLYLISQALQ